MTHFGWSQIARLGLVQASLGAIIVLITSVLNRVMVVELGLAAAIPGALVAGHYLVQVTRVHAGFGSDRSGRRTPWIIGGMAVVAVSGFVAAVATAQMATSVIGGTALAALACIALGAGVSVAGTPLLALLAERTTAARRGPAAAIVWLMMIAGFAITAATVGRLLDPFTLARMVTVSGGVSLVAFGITLVALWGLESPVTVPRPEAEAAIPFRKALAALWAEGEARRFAGFVFVAMLAYSAQDLILEPFAGTVFGLTPGETTRISSMQHGGMFLGMVGTAIATRRGARLTQWAAAGCLGSAAGFVALLVAGWTGLEPLLRASVFAMGAANGVFAIGAIGSMMALVDQPGRREAGVRMGLYGSAQAVAFGAGGLLGAGLSDVARALLGSPRLGYAAVFLLEAVLFVVAAWFAIRASAAEAPVAIRLERDGDSLLAAVG
ncbi:MAG: BCD family MFS transporter [Gemmatimonadales bacterium]|nr:BCD family MFS transporter [Gemmatimonadales bacterium]